MLDLSWPSRAVNTSRCSRGATTGFRHVVDALAVDADDASVGFQQAEDQLEDDRLSSAASTEQNHQTLGVHRETDLTQDHLVVEGQRHLLIGNRIAHSRIEPVTLRDSPVVVQRNRRQLHSLPMRASLLLGVLQTE